jgi:hypothetical protein
LQKRYKISFTGGEVTRNPDFLPFLSWLREQYAPAISNMGFTTNGSASVAYYLKAMDLVDYISFSSHFGQMKLEKFQKNILACYIRSVKRRKNIIVNIMQEQTDQIHQLESFCNNHKIPYSINQIDWNLS